MFKPDYERLLYGYMRGVMASEGSPLIACYDGPAEEAEWLRRILVMRSVERMELPSTKAPMIWVRRASGVRFMALVPIDLYAVKLTNRSLSTRVHT